MVTFVAIEQTLKAKAPNGAAGSPGALPVRRKAEIRANAAEFAKTHTDDEVQAEARAARNNASSLLNASIRAMREGDHRSADWFFRAYLEADLYDTELSRLLVKRKSGGRAGRVLKGCGPYGGGCREGGACDSICQDAANFARTRTPSEIRIEIDAARHQAEGHLLLAREAAAAGDYISASEHQAIGERLERYAECMARALVTPAPLFEYSDLGPASPVELCGPGDARRRGTWLAEAEAEKEKKHGPVYEIVKHGLIQGGGHVERAKAKELLAAHRRQAKILDKALYRDEKAGRTLMDRHEARKAREHFGACASRIAQLLGGLSKLFDLVDRIAANEAQGQGTELTLDEAEALTIFENCAEQFEERNLMERIESGTAGGVTALLSLLPALV